MSDEFKPIYTVSGWWIKEVHGPDGKLKERRANHNVVTTAGKDFIASFLVSAAAAASTFTCRYVAVGTGTTPETAGDTALVAELARTTATVTHNGAGVYQVVASFLTNSATGAVTEYGILSSSSAGTLLARDTETVVNVGSGDTLTVTAQITFS